MANQNIIELNGKSYDARTGKIVASGQQSVVKPTPQPVSLSGDSIDGFRQPYRVGHTVKQAATSIHKKAQASKTLMRKSVRKPQPIVKQPSAVHHDKTPAGRILDPPSSDKNSFDFTRNKHAAHIHKSKLISKFSDGEPRRPGQANIVPLPVAPEPKLPQTGQTAAQHTGQTLQHVIDHATSHLQAKPAKVRIHHRVAKKLRISPRILSISSITLAILLIGGYTAYQNVPNLAMHVASARAGVHASLPSYQPAGFSFTGPIKYKPGQITISFKSNSDNQRNFSITQSASSWDSQTLLENYVTPTGQPYQTDEVSGKTIYIYGTSNATWVDGGIWYNVQGNSSLNSAQLLRLADSI